MVDRDRAVRVLVLPVELAPRDRDVDLLLSRGRLRDVLDPGELDEDERSDEEQHDDRPRGPGQLDLRRAVDVRAVLEARALAAAVAEDEDEEQRLDEHEDPEREGRDEEVAVADPVCIR